MIGLTKAQAQEHAERKVYPWNWRANHSTWTIDADGLKVTIHAPLTLEGEKSSRLLVERISNLPVIEQVVARINDLEEALTPFANVGKIIDGPFGPVLFAKDDQAFKSGCAWTENGEEKTLTWGDFRRAAISLGKGEPRP